MIPPDPQEDKPAPKAVLEAPASPHIRFIPLGPDDKPPTGPLGFTPTEKQARFKETAVACVSESLPTGEGGVAAPTSMFPQWRLQHKRRCDERVSSQEWELWGADPKFTEWFYEDLIWPMTEGDKLLMDTIYHGSLARKLAAGDAKALEIHAKNRKFIGDNSEDRGGGLVVLLNWARGHGAIPVLPPGAEIIDTTSTPVDDAWSAARITDKTPK